MRPHSAAVEKVHSPKLNLPEGVLDDRTNETETPNEQISPDKGVVPADPTSSPVEDPSKVASATGSSQSTKKEKEQKGEVYYQYLLVKKLMDHPEYLLLLQGLLASITCYFLLGVVVWLSARGKANSVPNPFASISKSLEVNSEKDWGYVFWFWTKCFRWLFGPPPEVLNLEDAFPGLTPCQRRYVGGVMMKVHRLLRKGILEQRIEVAWKYVELTCMSVTPILVSILGNFGDKYNTPIQCLAIGLSLISSVCRLSPVGRGDVMTTYSLKLREICWNYWSLKGDFKVSKLDTKKEEMLSALAEQKYEASVSVEKDTSKDPDLLELQTKVQKAHGMLFQLFVEKVNEETQEGEAALSKTFSAPNASRKKATYGPEDGEKCSKDEDKSDQKQNRG